MQSSGRVTLANLTLCSTPSAFLISASSCSPCSGPGQYSDMEGSAFCKTAPAGHKPKDDRTGGTAYEGHHPIFKAETQTFVNRLGKRLEASLQSILDKL